jgi:manganese/iron transport system permease protein
MAAMPEWLEGVSRGIIDVLIAVLVLPTGLLPESWAAPFQYAFMQRALLSVVLVGGICGLLSSLVVLKRWSLLGDTISHAVLPGVALAYLFNLPFVLGAFISGALSSLAIGLIGRTTRIKEDAAMGIMLTGAFALGLVIISQIASSTHLVHILFGNVLGVRYESLAVTLAAAVVALLFVLRYVKELTLCAFDPIQAHSCGIHVGFFHYALILILTLTIVASLDTVGIVLVVAMLVTPGATAYLLCTRLWPMMMLSPILGITAGVLGLVLSFHWNVSSGGTIVLVASALFVLAWLLAPEHGLIARGLRQARIARAEADGH